MILDFNIILNVLIGLFLYNTIVKALSMTIIRYLLSTDVVKEHKKTFKEKLQEKIYEGN